MKKIESLKGMNDLVPEQAPVWQYVESVVAGIARSYGFSEIRFPALEQTELFKRSIGEVTDIVEKEMYSFDDRNGLSLTLRPEGTAGCVRACEQNGLLYNQTRKLWYQGPMFRYEKPQKGRLRQFHQIGFEAFGMPGPDVDAELLLLTARLWQALGVAEGVRLQLNSLGEKDDRARFRQALVAYLQDYKAQLDPDSQRRLVTNPLRILDSKDPQTQALLVEAPSLKDFVNETSAAHFDELCSLLDTMGVAYEINTNLVRGLDYYSNTVFEWVTDRLGAQGAVCSGGRYDGLVAQLGGRDTPAIGCAMGMERLILLVEQMQALPESLHEQLDVYLIVDAQMTKEALQLAEGIRNREPGLRLYTHTGGGSLKSQLKKADKSGAPLAIIVGGAEWSSGEVVVKPLRERVEQYRVSTAQVSENIKEALNARKQVQ